MEDLYRVIFEKARDTILIADPGTGRITGANEEAERLLNRKKKDIIGMHQSALHPIEEAEKYRTLFNDHAKAGFSAPMEIEVATSDGRRVPVELSARTIDLPGGKKLLHGIFRDISGRKKTELSLKESEAKYAALVEQSSDGLIILQDKGLKFMNSRMTQITGFTETEGKEKGFIDFVAPEDRKTVLENYQKRIAGEPAPSVYEIHILNKDGEKVPVEVVGLKIDYKGRPADMVILRDITERKKLQRMKDTLIRDVSHELKTPMAMIRMHLDQLLASAAEGNRGKMDSVIGNIGRDLERLQTDMDRILLYFAVHTGRAADVKEIDIFPLLEEIAGRASGLASARNNAIEWKGKGEGVKVRGDERDFGMLFQNIIENAAKFTENGAVTISVSKEKGLATVSVKDTGKGIEKANQVLLFERFFKEDPSIPGTGMGLPIAKEIAEMYNGSLRVISGGRDKGTEVIITLPAV